MRETKTQTAWLACYTCGNLTNNPAWGIGDTRVCKLCLREAAEELAETLALIEKSR